MPEPVILVIGYFEDLAHHLTGFSDELSLYLVTDTSWSGEWPHGRVIEIGHISRQAILRVLSETGLGKAVRAIVPGRERYTALSAELADLLGVEPAMPEAYRVLEDKYLLRRASHAAGITSTFFMLARDPAELARARSAVPGAGVVIKPRKGNASRGVGLIPPDADENESAKLFIRSCSDLAECLVEEYVEGSSYSVETVRRHGREIFQNVTGKTLSGTRAMSPFIPIRHTVPAALCADGASVLFDLQRRFLDSIGAHTGLFHAEWQVPASGEPYLVECAARFPGGGLADAVLASYGVNLAHLWLGALVGSHVAPVPAPCGYATSLSLTADRPGVLERIDGIEQVAALPEVKRIVQRATLGSTVRPAQDGFDRLLRVTLHADGAERLDQLSRLVENLVKLQIVPRDRRTPGE